MNNAAVGTLKNSESFQSRKTDTDFAVKSMQKIFKTSTIHALRWELKKPRSAVITWLPWSWSITTPFSQKQMLCVLLFWDFHFSRYNLLQNVNLLFRIFLATLLPTFSKSIRKMVLKVTTSHAKRTNIPFIIPLRVPGFWRVSKPKTNSSRCPKSLFSNVKSPSFSPQITLPPTNRYWLLIIIQVNLHRCVDRCNNFLEQSRIQSLLNWQSGVEFDYYDFWRNGINPISSEDIDDPSKIYLTSMKASVLKDMGLFEGSPPANARFPYFRSGGESKSQRDVMFMHNQICVLLNEVCKSEHPPLNDLFFRYGRWVLENEYWWVVRKLLKLKVSQLYYQL